MGKEQLLTFGKYPDVSLKDARDRRDNARKALADGKNPAVEKNARLRRRRSAPPTRSMLSLKNLSRR
jgi:hypothetical protein